MDQSLQDRRGSTSDRLKPGPNYSHPITIHYEIQNHTTRMQKITKAFQVYRLMTMTMICVIAGVIIGLICRRKAHLWSERQFMYIEFPGELYLRFLRLIIIPLLVSNVILSFGTIQGKISSQLGKIAGFIYLGNNFVAVTVAILIAIIICPGGRLKSGKLDISNAASQPTINAPSLANHHLFNEYHDSITRYREYHPMFYHSEHANAVQNVNHESSSSGSFRVASGESLINRELVDATARSTKTRGFSSQVDQSFNDPLLGQNNAIIIVDNDNEKAARRSDIIKEEILIEEPTQENAIRLQRKSKLNGFGRSQTENHDLNNNNNNEEGDKYIDVRLPRVRLIGVHNLERDLYDNLHHYHHQANNLFKSDSNLYFPNTKLPIDVVLDVFRNIIPDSLIGSALQQTRTRLFAPKETRIDKNGSMDPEPSLWPMGHEMINQPNIIGLLAVSVLAGVVLSHMEEASKPLLDLCSCISELSLRVGMKAINLAPPCIMFLLIGQVARARDLSSMAGELLMYCVTVILALLLHGFVLLPLIYYSVTKKSPFKFLKGMMEALVASIATSSSSATMPLVLNCLADLDLNLVVVRAFGPLGCVFNMNGTAIYEAIGVIFIAQTLSVPLPFTSILLIGFCSAVASLSTAGIPSSGMMNMVIVLNAINLPVLQLSLIYIVDFIIDRFRTAINVWSGAIVCGLVDHLCPEHLFEEEMKPEKYREMMKYRGSRGSLSNRKSLIVEEKPQVISVTITPPAENNNMTTSV